MYRYRDWVIDAVQPRHAVRRVRPRADRRRPAARAATRPTGTTKLIATGYLANARRFGSYEDARYPWHLTIEDTIDNLGRTFLGPDDQLRPLPRPQVRPDHAARTTTPCTASSPARATRGRASSWTRCSATWCRSPRRTRSRQFEKERNARSWPSSTPSVKQLDGREEGRADKALTDAEKIDGRARRARSRWPNERAGRRTQAEDQGRAEGARGLRQASRCRSRRPTPSPRGRPRARRRSATPACRSRATPNGSGRKCRGASRRCSAARRCRRDAKGSGRLRAGGLDHRPEEPADGPGDGQPHLAVSLRPGHRADAERLRQAGPAADAPGAARLPGGAVRRERLVGQGDAPADHAVADLPASPAATTRRTRGSTSTTTTSGGSTAAGSTPSRSATRCWRSAANLDRTPGGPHPFPPMQRRGTSRSTSRSRPSTTRTAAAST